MPEPTTIRDYNTDPRWTPEAVQARYRQICRDLRLPDARRISPRIVDSGPTRWVFPVIDDVLEGVRHGDRACVELAVRYLVDDPRAPFSRSAKPRLARLLRNSDLSEGQKERLRARIVALFELPYPGREFRWYLNLLRRIGIGDHETKLRRYLESPSAFHSSMARYALFGSPLRGTG